MNREEVGIDLREDGVYFRTEDGRLRVVRWDRYLDARLGNRVLLLFFDAQKAKVRRRRYLAVPIHGLNASLKNELLLTLPERLRSKKIKQALVQWRLG